MCRYCSRCFINIDSFHIHNSVKYVLSDEGTGTDKSHGFWVVFRPWQPGSQVCATELLTLFQIMLHCLYLEAIVD